MSDSHELLKIALSLTPRERLELAVELMDSVEGLPDDEWTSAWRDELLERVRAADDREERGRDWTEVRQHLLELLADR